MTGGILRDLANAADSRRAARKEFLAASKRLAKRIVESGRVGDQVEVNGREYIIGNVLWYLKENPNNDLLSTPQKTLVCIASNDTALSLLDLVQPPLAAEVAADKFWIDDEEAENDPTDPVGPYFSAADLDLDTETKADGMDCRQALELDYEIFAEECIDVVEAFIELFKSDAESYRVDAQTLDGQQLALVIADETIQS